VPAEEGESRWCSRVEKGNQREKYHQPASNQRVHLEEGGGIHPKSEVELGASQGGNGGKRGGEKRMAGKQGNLEKSHQFRKFKGKKRQSERLQPNWDERKRQEPRLASRGPKRRRRVPGAMKIFNKTKTFEGNTREEGKVNTEKGRKRNTWGLRKNVGPKTEGRIRRLRKTGKKEP